MARKAGACKKCGGSPDCETGSYKKMEKKCKAKGAQAHHIVPDYTLRKGTRPVSAAAKSGTSDRINGMPSLNDGVCICMKGDAATPGTEHNIAHECDAAIALKKNDDGTVKLDDVLTESKKSSSKARPECAQAIEQAVNEQYKDVNKNQLVRGKKYPPRKGFPKETLDAFGSLPKSSTPSGI